MDPYAVLGVDPGASPAELSAAYRRAAKRWHPDRGGGRQAELRMAQLNAAYEILRGGLTGRRAGRRRGAEAPAGGRARRPGAWLSEELRRALGPELLAALEDRENVVLVTRAATWASASTLLAVTDRRLLWLLDDAVSARVRSLPLRTVVSVEHRLARLRRRTAVVRVQALNGRRVSFFELAPSTAAAIARHVACAAPAAS